MASAVIGALATLSMGASKAEPKFPPANPFLADSVNPIGHGSSAQQDSVPVAGPAGPSRDLAPNEIEYIHLGPGHFGAQISSPYPDGRRVLWSNGVDRIVKVDHDSFKVLATYRLPGKEESTEASANRAIEEFNTRTGIRAIWYAFKKAKIFRDLSGVYTLLDADGNYYIGDNQGNISVYADADSGNPDSAIEKKRTFHLPETVDGLMVGMNMTYDGWLVLATEHGYLIAISRDFERSRVIRLRYSEGADRKATGSTGRGWIRNGFAIDEQGGIYVASQDHMHKVIWQGETFSLDEKDGAWTAAYPNGTGEGTGATPSLMGFGDEDRFVVITDGEPLMNVTLFWRDEIPNDWQGVPGAPSRRIAGTLPANMGDPELRAIQSEQSVVVAGYGALVVNNIPRDAPWWLPRRARTLLISFLGSDPRYQPFGVQKFEWNPKLRRLENAWVRRDVSSPNCVPIVSLGSNLVYFVGARQGRWTLEALDWATGDERFHYVVGDQRYNSLFSGTLLDENGRIFYGTTWGRVRLDPHS